MSLRVTTTAETDQQIREVDEWWRLNRRAAPNLFLDELSQAFELLAEIPQVGRIYRQSPIQHTRRLLLRETRYHLYYLVTSSEVNVLAVWHARRGVGPPLRMR